MGRNLRICFVTIFLCWLQAILYTWYVVVFGDRGGTVLKVLHYKSEGRWFDSR
jgi:hypothetical protein